MAHFFLNNCLFCPIFHILLGSRSTLSSKQLSIDPVQQFAKAVLKRHWIPSKTATLGVLGSLPTTDQINIIWVTYFWHRQQIDDHRCSKMNYTNHLICIRTINQLLLAYMLKQWGTVLKKERSGTHDIKSCCFFKFKYFTQSIYQDKFVQNVPIHSGIRFTSLLHYQMVNCKLNTLCTKHVWRVNVVCSTTIVALVCLAYGSPTSDCV